MEGTQEHNNELFDDSHDSLDKALLRLDSLPVDDDAVKKAWPKFLRELMDVLKNELMRDGHKEDAALKLAQKLVARQAHCLCGLPGPHADPTRRQARRGAASRPPVPKG